MKTLQRCCFFTLLFTISTSDARRLCEHEINNEAIKSVLADDSRTKDVFALNQKSTGFDFTKINSSTERPMLNIDMIYDQIEALERHLAGVSVQLQALKSQVREARHVAQEQHEVAKNQTQELMAQLQETREKLNQTQQRLALADQRQHQLEEQVAQLAQAEKPDTVVMPVVVDDHTVLAQAPLAS